MKPLAKDLRDYIISMVQNSSSAATKQTDGDGNTSENVITQTMQDVIAFMHKKPVHEVGTHARQNAIMIV